MNTAEFYESMYGKMVVCTKENEVLLWHTVKNVLTVFLAGTYLSKWPAKIGDRMASLN